MKKISIYLFLLAFSMTLPLMAGAEPYAPPIKLNAQGLKMLKLQNQTEADRLKEIPDRSEVGIPPYPGAVFTAGMGPMMEDGLPSLNLVSTDSQEKIKAWYADRLKGWSWDETFGSFHEGEGKLDMSKMYSTPAVIILEAAKESFDLMFADMPNVRTRIQILYRPVKK